MRTYLTRRLFTILLVWLGVTILTFFIANVIPTDPVALRLGPKASPEAIIYWRHQYGLDQPLPNQYFRFVGGLFRLDLGTSIWSGRAITDDLHDYLPATLELALVTLVISLAAGIPLGVAAANTHSKWLDTLIQILSTFGTALPLFWVGLVFQLLFYRDLSLLPFDSRIDMLLGPPIYHTGFFILDSLLAGDAPRLGSSLVHIILPAVTLSLPVLGGVIRMTRGSVLDVKGMDFIRTARAKGIPWKQVLRKHVLRNALLPVVTLTGNLFNAMLAGTFVVEAIFNWPGLGWYATHVILASDYMAVVSITLVVAVLCTLVNLAVDLLYGVLDPRIQLA
jgi:peptide/nickel transport system permease protein